MDRLTYESVYEHLNSPSNIKALTKKYNVSTDTLSNLLCQKIVRQTTRNHYKIKRKAKELSKRWDNGETFTKIAKSIDYSPYMTVSIILGEKGYSRKRIRDLFNNPAKLIGHMASEIRDVLTVEHVYSPECTKEQTVRGKYVEDKIGRWLTAKARKYITEEEARKLHKKTPDFLLDKTMKLDGQYVKWVECKATFGDDFEIRRDHKKQLKHYVELFGPGCVVYWYGFLPDIEYASILIKSRSYFKSH